MFSMSSIVSWVLASLELKYLNNRRKQVNQPGKELGETRKRTEKRKRQSNGLIT